MTPILAVNVLDPLVRLLETVIKFVHTQVHNYGWTMIAIAALVKLVTWPLNQMQIKSMARMQAVAPQLKAVQAKYKGDPQKIQAETMALYQKHGVNPVAGCLPLVLQMPILFSIYYAIVQNKAEFAKEQWVWIGSSFAAGHPGIFAQNLAGSDTFLLALYIASMYLSMRFSSLPSADPAQARQQKIMAIVMPIMLAVFFFRAQWPSALVLYWLTFNILQTAQQFFLMRRYHIPLHEVETGLLETAPAPVAISKNGAPKNRSRRSRRRSRR